MAHNVETLAYRGAVPWHGIGFELLDVVTPVEMLRAAQLDWTVSKRPMFTADHKDFINQPAAYTLQVPDMYALVRDSDNKFFGVCGPKYQPFQNSETFEFFNKFTEAGHMKMEVAGSLKNGLWVWALARLEDGLINLLGDDTNYTYLLLVSPHIWGEAMNIMFTSVRVVCWNTLTQAMGKGITDKFRAIHSRSFSDVRGLAELSVEQAMINKAVYEVKAKLLAETKIVDVTKLYNYIAKLFQPDLVHGSDANPGAFGRVAGQILLNYNTAPGSKMESAMGTWWGAYNAVTYFFDHQYGRSGPGERLFEAWVSHGNAVKKRHAFDMAVEYAQAA